MRRNSQSVGFGLNEEGWMSVMDLRVCVGWPAVMVKWKVRWVEGRMLELKPCFWIRSLIVAVGMVGVKATVPINESSP